LNSGYPYKRQHTMLLKVIKFFDKVSLLKEIDDSKGVYVLIHVYH